VFIKYLLNLMARQIIKQPISSNNNQIIFLHIMFVLYRTGRIISLTANLFLLIKKKLPSKENWTTSIIPGFWKSF
jgi:hypothetical protein